MAAVRGLTGGADYAFEALGREETVQQAWASLDVRGQLVLVGLLPGGARITLDAGPFVSGQSVKGCYFGSADISGRRTCTATSRFWSAIICVASWRWMRHSMICVPAWARAVCWSSAGDPGVRTEMTAAVEVGRIRSLETFMTSTSASCG